MNSNQFRVCERNLQCRKGPSEVWVCRHVLSHPTCTGTAVAASPGPAPPRSPRTPSASQNKVSSRELLSHVTHLLDGAVGSPVLCREDGGPELLHQPAVVPGRVGDLPHHAVHCSLPTHLSLLHLLVLQTADQLLDAVQQAGPVEDVGGLQQCAV